MRTRIVTTALLLSAAGCAAPPAESGDGDTPGVVVVGITSDFLPGVDVGRLEAEVSIDGVEAPRKTWTLDGGEPLAFPIELPLEGLPDGARVDLRFATFESTSTLEPPFLTRQAATSAVAGQKLLLRTHLEWECVPGFILGGETTAPTCVAPDTCIAAECDDPYVPPGSLELYSPSWAVDFADECRPLDAGPPELAIGEGIETFSALAPGGGVQMHLGSQGGYHIWLALRMKNLHRVGSTTTISAKRADTGEELCGATLPRDFSPVGDGACDLVGIQCVVTLDVMELDALIGQTVALSAKVVDITGDVGFSEQDATLSTQP